MGGRKLKGLAFLMVALFLFNIALLFSGCDIVFPEKRVERISGVDRYETAVEISKSGWTTAEIVVLARGDAFPDGLAGTPLAYQENAPILLTPSAKLNSSTKGEIQRLEARKVIILGGAAAISEGVESELLQMGLEVDRIGGANRYETARLIAESLPGADTSVLVFGENFPDALAAGSFAAQRGYPLFLTLTDHIPEATKEGMANLNIDKTIIAGGPSVISDEAGAQAPNPIRIGGADRYETAAEIIRYFNPSTEVAYVVTGLNFADALTGSALAAQKGAFLLLVSPDSVPPSIKRIIDRKEIKEFIIIGGEGAVKRAVENELLD